MKHIDKVAAYFDNELSEAEKQDFLKELEANPELKSEFEFQQQVVEGIQAARKAELKAMLDKLEPKLVSTFKDMVQGLYVEHAESCSNDEDDCPYLTTYLEASRIADNF